MSVYAPIHDLGQLRDELCSLIINLKTINFQKKIWLNLFVKVISYKNNLYLNRNIFVNKVSYFWQPKVSWQRLMNTRLGLTLSFSLFLSLSLSLSHTQIHCLSLGQRWVCWASKSDLSSKTKCDQNPTIDNYEFVTPKVGASMSFCWTNRPQGPTIEWSIFQAQSWI